jgi:hypothetical protein
MLALSMHIGLEDKYNSIHPHARCEKDALISGVYYNSEDVIPMIRYKKDNWFVAPAIEKNGARGLVIGLEF